MGQIRDLRETEIEQLSLFIKEETGIDLNSYRKDFIKRRFLPRAQLLGFKDLGDYIEFLKKNNKEKEVAKRKIFVQTTEFFRNREVFEKVEEIVSYEFRNDDLINIVSAPCSTGEEAFSLAIILSEAEKQFNVFAIDGNLLVLKNLKRRHFTKKNLFPLYKSEIKRYFIEEGNIFFLKEEILSRVFPIQADLTENFPIKNSDIVFMRNFFIYLKEKAFLKCVKNIEKSLRKGGLLVLGKVERVDLDKSCWEALDLQMKIFRFKGGKQ